MSERNLLTITTTLIIACVAANLHGNISNIVLPYLISSYIEHFNLTESRAGGLATFETLITAFVAFMIARKFGHFSSVKIALLGGVFVVTGQFVTAISPDNMVLIAGRCLVGLGAGITIAIANALIGITVNPERMFGIAWSASLIIEGGLYLVIPSSIAEMGYPGFYFLLIITLFLFLLPFIWLKDMPESKKVSKEISANILHYGWLTMIAILVLFVSLGGLWGFLERLASDKLGMTLQALGNTLALSLVFAFAGATLAGWLGLRIGRKAPIISSIILLIFISLSIVMTPSVAVFKVSLLGLLFFTYFLIPYLLGLASTIGDQGRFAAIGSVMFVLGSAIGPWVCGMLVESSGYEAITWLMASGCFIALCILVYVMQKMDMTAQNPGNIATDRPEQIAG